MVTSAGAADTAGGEGGGAEALGPAYAELQQYEADVEQSGAQLAEMMSSGAVDCAAAEGLRDRICDLSERICEISGRHPDDGQVAGRCEAGRDRCQSAREDVDDAC